MKDRKMSKAVTDSDFRRLVESKNVRKAVMVKDGKVFKIWVRQINRARITARGFLLSGS